MAIVAEFLDLSEKVEVAGDFSLRIRGRLELG